ncbi:peptidase C15 [Okeania sp.]|uniref:pyroglutamyl-peptidase I family protein n=1 Tax=Okeania sp. TaxID=3100323 RepID=UPI002B4B0206|nr:peptidase C15 [Okeania sp.]MEB3341488.1 peptidase C15 [Okeania sp.]
MKIKILFTSFDTWKTEQTSNSSDDLLGLISTQELTDYSLSFIRKLPVDSVVAPEIVISQIDKFKPDIIVCCGMAEARDILTIESQACSGERVMKTSVDLSKLVVDLHGTKISNDAGKFVCEDLYYSVLKYLDDCCLKTKCIFVHVPILTAVNQDLIVADFLNILSKISP